MRAPRRLTLSLLAPLLAALVALPACGSGDDEGGGGPATTTGGPKGGKGDVVATAANYELLADRDQRFITGLVVNGEGTVVSFGSVDLEFFYLGTKEDPIDPPQSKFKAKATFMPIAGGDAAKAAREEGPRIVRPSEGVGVYRAEPVRFDQAGYWGVRATGTLVGEGRTAINADTAVEVRAEPLIPAPGAAAPRTENPTVASHGEHDPTLDSRAEAGKPLADPQLHATTVAAALAAGKPVVVVVSTPVFCMSRFCGPITDAVQAIAQRRAGDDVAFVHIEVWQDFEAKKINPAAAEWAQLPTKDMQEPWVFTVGRDGRIVERFDNVVSDAELEAAVARIAA